MNNFIELSKENLPRHLSVVVFETEEKAVKHKYIGVYEEINENGIVGRFITDTCLDNPLGFEFLGINLHKGKVEKSMVTEWIYFKDFYKEIIKDLI